MSGRGASAYPSFKGAAAMAWQSIPNWRTLPSVHRSRPDPYCIWAELTDWAHYPNPVTPPPRPFWLVRVILCVWGRIFGPPYEQGCGPDAANPNTRAVIIELTSAENAEDFIDLARTADIHVPSSYDPRKGARRTCYMTARAATA